MVAMEGCKKRVHGNGRLLDRQELSTLPADVWLQAQESHEARGDDQANEEENFPVPMRTMGNQFLEQRLGDTKTAAQHRPMVRRIDGSTERQGPGRPDVRT